VHNLLLPVQKCNNVRDLYELPDFCPLNSPDLSTFISKYEAEWQVILDFAPSGSMERSMGVVVVTARTPKMIVGCE